MRLYLRCVFAQPSRCVCVETSLHTENGRNVTQTDTDEPQPRQTRKRIILWNQVRFHSLSPLLAGRGMDIVGQTNAGAGSKATVGKLLKDRVERMIRAFPNA